MGKQYNKVEKRTRRKNYLKRNREKLLAAKKLSKSTNDNKGTVKKGSHPKKCCASMKT